METIVPLSEWFVHKTNGCHFESFSHLLLGMPPVRIQCEASFWPVSCYWSFPEPFLFHSLPQLTVDMFIKILPMIGFDPRTSRTGSNHSANWAITTAQQYLPQILNCADSKPDKDMQKIILRWRRVDFYILFVQKEMMESVPVLSWQCRQVAILIRKK